MLQESTTSTRRDFLKVGAVAGLALASAGVLGGCTAEETPDPAGASQEHDIAGSDIASVEEPRKDTIFIADIIHCKPGDGKALYDHYMERYAPGAEQRGMTLESAGVNPPIWLEDDDSSNTLEFIWSVPGMMGWASMVGVSRYDPTTAAQLIEFWRDIDDRVISRTRTLSAADTDIESLTTLANLGN